MAADRLIADIVRRGGGRLLDAAVNRLLPVGAGKLAPAKKTVLGGIAGAAVTRVATRSVPGAIVVGGALLAKRLYDKRHGPTADGTDAGKAKPKA